MTATEDTWPSLVVGDNMQPFEALWNQMSRRGIYPVVDNTERDTLVGWLATKGMPAPSADNPLYVHNKARASGQELQRSIDGSAWTSLVGYSSAGPSTSAVGGGASGSITFRQLNGVVYVYGISIQPGSAANGATIGSFNAALFGPPAGVNGDIALSANDDGVQSWLRLTDSGSVRLFHYNALATNYLRGSGSYPKG